MPSDPKTGTPRPFDIKTIEQLIDLMARHELGEITLIEGEQRIRLRKNSVASFTNSTAMPAAAPVSTALAVPAAIGGNAAPPATPAKKYHEIKSPMVGTYYSKPAPDKSDYVSVGSTVNPKSIVCKIEAMKIFNDIFAEVSGTIVEVCVKNTQAVDYGTVLFRVDLS